MLAIDGGNSKTDVALVAADGTLLGARPRARVTGVPDGGDDRRHRRHDRGRGAGGGAGAPAGRSRSDTVAPAWPTPTCPRRRSSWPGCCAAQGWGTRTTVANDTFAVLRAGLVTPAATPWGVGGDLRRRHQLRGRRPGRADHRLPGARRASPATGAAASALGQRGAVVGDPGRGRPRAADRAARRRCAAHFGLADGPRRGHRDPPGQDRAPTTCRS